MVHSRNSPISKEKAHVDHRGRWAFHCGKAIFASSACPCGDNRYGLYTASSWVKSSVSAMWKQQSYC